MAPRRATEQIDAGVSAVRASQTPGFEYVVRDGAFSARADFQPILWLCILYIYKYVEISANFQDIGN